MPTTTNEKLAFSQRLKLALKRSQKKVETPTDLALQFNLRHKSEPITPQAAVKWLNGTAKPTLDKIETLATWLNVSVQWLRYGIPEQKPVKSSKPLSKATATNQVAPNATELKLIQRIRNLPETRRELIVELVEQFSIGQEIWQS